MQTATIKRNYKKGNPHQLFYAFLLFVFPFFTHAQIENVIVETYYVSDQNDQTDSTGGGLEAGSKTYRIFVDMVPGTVLKKIYGDANHALRFSSTENFFNNKADGQTFGKDFSKNRLSENTVALDSWITLGQVTRVSSGTSFGVCKYHDSNGSFVGGNHNDGGSAAIPGGLLINSDPSAGIPLTIADGNDVMTVVPSSWATYGIVDPITGTDSTIFGSLLPGNEFISFNAGLQNSGVKGVNPDTNIVLVAQLTTKGSLSFEINLEVEIPNGSGMQTIKYVANGDVLLAGERVCPFLKYPSACGCTDPQFLEYSPAYACSNEDSCKNKVVFGCMDASACNFDPNANFHIQSLCCYPGLCADRDISLVCPQIANERSRNNDYLLFPNPAQDKITFQAKLDDNKVVHYELFDSFGKVVRSKNIGSVSGLFSHEIDLNGFSPGFYILRIFIDQENKSLFFVID